MTKETHLDTKSIAIIDAVKAEAARVGVSGRQMAKALGRDRNFVYKRMRYECPFDTNELQIIAKLVGTTIAGLLRSAEVGSEIRAESPTEGVEG